MTPALDIEQFEMMLNDPRLAEAEPSVMDDIKLMIEISKKHGGVLAKRQVATMANVSPATITRHVQAGRFTLYNIVGMELIPLDEAMAYLKARNEDLLSKGGHGLKAPKFKELLKVE